MFVLNNNYKHYFTDIKLHYSFRLFILRKCTWMPGLPHRVWGKGEKSHGKRLVSEEDAMQTSLVTSPNKSKSFFYKLLTT